MRAQTVHRRARPLRAHPAGASNRAGAAGGDRAELLRGAADVHVARAVWSWFLVRVVDEVESREGRPAGRGQAGEDRAMNMTASERRAPALRESVNLPTRGAGALRSA